jgi:heme A synthase
MPDEARRFRPYAWFVLLYTIAVILFGAWVRVTGSGAGCGQHWPTCHGEVVHHPASVETMIELTHRVTSAADGLLVLGLLFGAVRVFPREHLGRRAALGSLVFVILEGLLGAALVKLELVANDTSALRALVMSLHLVNTSLLTGAMALVAFAATPSLADAAPSAAPHRSTVPLRPVATWLGVGLVATLLVMMAGAVTALGDTVLPVVDGASKLSTLRADHGVDAHFLQRLRVIHPLAAVATALYLILMALHVADRCPTPSTRGLAWSTVALVVLQVLGGVVNIVLSAPGWMQLVHLGLATVSWVVLVWLAASALRWAAPHRRAA